MWNNSPNQTVESGSGKIASQIILDEDGNKPKNILLSNYARTERINEIEKNNERKFDDLRASQAELKTEIHVLIHGQTKWYIGSLFTLVGVVIAALKFIFHL